MKAKVLIGGPELDRWARGESVVIRLKEGTTELELQASAIAQGQLSKKRDSIVDFLDRVGYPQRRHS